MEKAMIAKCASDAMEHLLQSFEREKVLQVLAEYENVSGTTEAERLTGAIYNVLSEHGSQFDRRLIRVAVDRTMCTYQGKPHERM